MRVLVYGTGIMGKGITQLMIQNNHYVYWYNPEISSTKEAIKSLSNKYDKLIAKEKITEMHKKSFMSNIEVVESLSGLSGLSLAIEAVTEDIGLKKSVFIEMDKSLNRETILASNTSSLSITQLALVTSRPEKVLGMHFFNPAPIMELVEIIAGTTTSPETISSMIDFCQSMGKKPVYVKESPGFIVNRMLVPMINEAIAILSEGVAKATDIDIAMMSGANHPIGPLALADLIGLDVCLNIMDILHSELREDKYKAHPTLRKMVKDNKMGRKTFEGFYIY